MSNTEGLPRLCGDATIFGAEAEKSDIFPRPNYPIDPIAHSHRRGHAVMGWGVVKPKRILIVDDHAALRMALRHVIDSVLEFEVCGEAENGREGIERAGELQPDLIVLDLSMPVMNGFEAARELKALFPSVPLLLYTSFVSSNVEDAALAAGVSKVASKSSPPEALVEDLRTLLKCAS
jgi:CheY-like chemotaxis protein